MLIVYPLNLSQFTLKSLYYFMNNRDAESSGQITGEEGPREEVAPGNGKQSGTGLAEKLMPPEHMEL